MRALLARLLDRLVERWADAWDIDWPGERVTHIPPPQAAAIGLGLAWNYQRSRVGKRTISMWAREHKHIAIPAVLLGVAWLVPHWWHD